MKNLFTLVFAATLLALLFTGMLITSPNAGAQTLMRSRNVSAGRPSKIVNDLRSPISEPSPPGKLEPSTVVAAPQENAFEISVKSIDDVIAIQSGNRPSEEIIRVFSGGQLVDNQNLAFGLDRKAATYFPDARTIIVRGEISGNEVVEEIRFVELSDDRVVLLRDLYLDGADADVSVGRGLPFVISTENVAPTTAGSETRRKGESLLLAATAAPYISSISGVTSTASGISNGKVAMSCGKVWNGYYAINNETGAYKLTLYGSNFGSSPGTVTLAGRNAKILSWSNSAIVIDPTYPYDAGPVCAIFKITTAGGSVLNSGLNIVPAIKTRIYGQCTHHVAWNRLRMGKQPSASAYGGYSSITGSYVPARGDQYQFNGASHTAIVVGVSGPAFSSGGVKTWTLTVSEQNYDCNNSIRQYTTYFKTQTVNTTTSVLSYPRASYGSYASTLYYR